MKKDRPTSGRDDKAVAKAFALMSKDLENIKSIRDKCINKKIFLNDSAAVRVALDLAAHVSEEILIKYSLKARKVNAGRPKSS